MVRDFLARRMMHASAPAARVYAGERGGVGCHLGGLGMSCLFTHSLTARMTWKSSLAVFKSQAGRCASLRPTISDVLGSVLMTISIIVRVRQGTAKDLLG